MSQRTQTQRTDDARSNVETLDPIWVAVRADAERIMTAEPALASFVHASVLSHDRLEIAVAHRVAQRLGAFDLAAGLVMRAFEDVLASDAQLATTFRADLAAVRDRDPACTRFVEPLLYFKGFHALVTHRFAHAMWHGGRRDLALYLQSQASRIMGVDIHPAARFGQGIMLDHATGFVVGETAVVGDNCSFLHGVTLGGSGKEGGDRHPKIGDNVLIGAGASVLGNIRVGNCSLVAAGSVVLNEVPPMTTVAGVPARVVGPASCPEPARAMNQGLKPGDCVCKA
jgi:serine O-acetyltransferase